MEWAIKLFWMKKHSPSLVRFDPSLDLTTRIALVMSACQSSGHVSRKSLIATYGLSQQQAGSLMRDFIHAHAKHLQWDVAHARYSMKS
jgi:hypothetical protein